MSLKLLAVGDMHLGRRPSRLPDDLTQQGGELSPAVAWSRLVDAAIDEDVDVVALAGDVVEREDDFYEAGRQLHAGVARLASAGIRVVGVAGNHDVQVLPRLVRELPDFELIGANGQWEPWSLEQAGETLTLWGWSFPRKQVHDSPLAGQTFQRRPGLNLGLLHCDRDQPGSHYGPISSAELRGAGLDGWLLGHIHKPDALSLENPSGYLGSVSGMDPGEAGDRGPWLLQIERGRLASLEQWVLAPIRFEPLQLDLTELEEAEAVRSRLAECLRQIDARISQSFRPPDAVGLRVTLNGRSRFGKQALAILESERQGANNVSPGGSSIRYFIEKLIPHTLPEIPLAELADRQDPAGLLARRLLLLDSDGDSEARRRLLAEGRERLMARARDPRWQGLGEPSLDDAAVADWLRQAGRRLLEQMLRQQDGGQAA
ncbi:DNA repair exonuclease SbcCD nuclease subunit [Natronospira proteinivora]|uniref:DNA repair exonuclease SbcCD nuclease subunit n=1 Tax=Natronospira proteinivora TaxID=1807133 RepID=A0ABT1G6X2_9GAMM|nr:DNA repair exonuclease [Natronospira proteinivora]MCP1727052.1 DNA repair exonuclease SbcCD nuclease subunit [Natronospira proteinivora]